MRTIKRNTVSLNKEKQTSLEQLCLAYSRGKQHFLQMLKGKRFVALLGTPRKIRDSLVKEDYQSPYGLQARHWKLALQDAIDTWDAYWKALFLAVRSRVSSHILKDEERHYAYWLLSHYGQFSLLMLGRHTPYRHVKTILLDRFHRRLEAVQTATVPGRTLDTVQRGVHPALSNAFALAGSG